MKNPWHFLRTSWLQLILLPSLITVFFCQVAFLVCRKLEMLCCEDVTGLSRPAENLQIPLCWCVSKVQMLRRDWCQTLPSHMCTLVCVESAVCTLHSMHTVLSPAGPQRRCSLWLSARRRDIQKTSTGVLFRTEGDKHQRFISSSYIFISFGRAHLDISCFVDW